MKTITNFALYFLILVVSSVTIGVIILKGFHIETANATQAHFIQLAIMLFWVFVGLAAWDRDE